MGLEEASGALFAIDAFRTELVEAGHTELLMYIRSALQLNEEHLDELRDSLQETIDEYSELRDSDGRRVSLMAAMHERPKRKRRR